MSWVGLASLLCSLSCSRWLLPRADMLDVPREVAVAEGYTVPVEASQVHVRDRATAEARTTWFRYQMPPEPLRDLRNDLREDPDIRSVEALPGGWPDFSDLGFEAPRWWGNEGERFVQDLAGIVPGGRAWALSDDGIVCVWIWSWEGWVQRPDLTPVPAPQIEPEPAP